MPRRCWQSRPTSADRIAGSSGIAPRSHATRRDACSGLRSGRSVARRGGAAPRHGGLAGCDPFRGPTSSPRHDSGGVCSRRNSSLIFAPRHAGSGRRPSFRIDVDVGTLRASPRLRLARLMRHLNRSCPSIGSAANRAPRMRSRPHARHCRHRHVLYVVGGWAHCLVNFHKTNKVCRERGATPRASELARSHLIGA